MSFFNRLQRKLQEIIPILLFSVIVLIVSLLLYRVIVPFLPENIRSGIQLLESSSLSDSIALLKNNIENAPYAGIHIFLGLQIAQVLVAPIPGQVTGFAGGYIYGFWEGLALSMFGLVLGTSLVTFLSRIVGKPFVKLFLSQEKEEKLLDSLSNGGISKFLIIFLLPALPDDAICFVAGLTKYPLWKLVLMSFLGRLPGMALLSYAGSQSMQSTTITSFILGFVAVISLGCWLYSDELEKKLSFKSK